jgi:hypothetical protein
MSTPHADNLVEAAHAVGVALDGLEATQDIAGLADAVNQALDRLNELNTATRQITDYLEQMVVLAKQELGGA